MNNTIAINNQIQGGNAQPRRGTSARSKVPALLRKLAGFPVTSFVMAAALMLLLQGCTTTSNIPPVPPSFGSSTAGAPVVLREGDVVKFFFPGAAEFSNVQKIRTDGKLSMPMIGEVQAAGKTVSRLQSELSHRYKSELQNTEVVVSLESGGLPVIITGGVANPNKYLFDRPTTLLEAIMGAGGFTDYARKKKVRLIRMEHGQYRTWVCDMSQGLTGGSTPIVYVKAGDVIHVPISNW